MNGTDIMLIIAMVRCVLADRRVNGMFHYTDDVIKDAVRAEFLFNQAPSGFALDDIMTPTQVVPDLVASGGDLFAWIVFDTALLLITGEDGKMQIRTKVIWVRDEGERKRDLLIDLRIKVFNIKHGDAQFTTYQSFIAFLGNMPASGDNNLLGPIAEFSTINLETGIQQLTI